MDRTILHCDMNGFFASVELLERPDLVNKPMAVSGDPANRHGIILAKNEIAKGYGVVTAETIWQAKKKCPELTLVRPHHEKYRHYSKLINQIYERFTDMVEPFSIDESWLDVTGSLKLFGDGRLIADEIRRTVKKELNLTLSAGVSFNKIFAKMGSEYKKPDATTLIGRENFREILWPLPVSDLFFVGRMTAEKLSNLGIRTIGDLAGADRSLLITALGKQGEVIHAYANGNDDAPVLRSHERRRIKSVGNGITFKRNLEGESDVKTALLGLSDTVASRLRKYQLKAAGVKVDIRDPYFKTISRQKQLESPTDLAEEISRAALSIVRESWNLKNPIRMLTITGINLGDASAEEQLSFFAPENESREKSLQIEHTIDSIRAKYGDSAITFGSILHNDMGLFLEDSREED